MDGHLDTRVAILIGQGMREIAFVAVSFPGKLIWNNL
jgi:hypothetical protein